MPTVLSAGVPIAAATADARAGTSVGARLFVPLELPAARLRVDDADHARGRGRRPLAQRLEAVEDRPGLSDTGRLDQHHLRAGAPRDLVDGRPELRLHAHFVADAAAGQLHHVARAALDESRVDVDATELVDDHRHPTSVLRAEDAVQDRRLARPQEAGQENERRLALTGGHRRGY